MSIRWPDSVRHLFAALLVFATVGSFACAGSVGRMTGTVPTVGLEQIPRSQYKILATVVGKGETQGFFCFWTLGDSQFGFTSYGGSGSGLGILAGRKDAVAAATYDAISKVPDADMLLPLTSTTSISGLPCFRSERATVRGKAIQLLSD